MMNPDEKAEREGLLRMIAALLEDRLFDHDLRKLLANVSIDRHMQLHQNKKPTTVDTGQTFDRIQSFIACTDNFCRNVNQKLREFKKPEFTTNNLILSAIHEKYKVSFITFEGAITVSLIERSKDETSRIITQGSEATQ